jgi:hypothetical protein
MRTLRTVVVALLVTGVSTSALAGDLRVSLAQAGQQPPREGGQPAESKPIPKAYLWTGTGMFVGGMAVGLYAFIHNKNGQFPGQDEYYATNRALGAAGLLTAFGGGAVLLIGKRHANRSPMITVGPAGVKVSKNITW